jgi:small-conductance mechanosensitive channel
MFQSKRKSGLLRVSLAAVLSTLFFVCTVSSQVETQNAGSESEQTSAGEAAVSPTPAPTPIPVSDINSRAEDNRNRIEVIGKGLELSQSVRNIQTELPQLRKTIDQLSTETKGLLAAKPSLESLKMAEKDWQYGVQQIPTWKKSLGTTITVYDSYLKDLKTMRETWALTMDAVQPPKPAEANSGNTVKTVPNLDSGISVPSEIISTVRSVMALISNTEKKVNEQKTLILALQSRVIRQDTRASDMLENIADLRSEAFNYLLVRDSPPIWSASSETASANGVLTEVSATYRAQLNSIETYLSEKRESLILHFLIFVGFAAIMFWARRRLGPIADADPELKPAFSVFELPITGALILAIMLSGRFYPQAPRMLMSIFGAAALVPGVFYLRRILEKPFYPILNALVVFYLVDLVRQITATLPVFSRLIFTAEMIAAILFLVWFIWLRKGEDDSETEYQNIFVVVRKVIPFIIGLFTVALVAGTFGFVSLSRTIGNSVLSSAYTALILYTAVQILKSLIVFGLRLKPVAALGMVRNHRPLIKQKLFTVLKWLGILIWVLLTLNLFSIRQDVLGFATDWLTMEFELGSIAIYVGDVIVFCLAIWLSFVVSRIVRFVLEEDVYPNVTLAGGVSYAISTVLHYLLLVAGLLLAIASVGIDLSKFTILAGAIGVGLGFGMQAIVNNFVSGLILLFERPVKVDDFIQVGEHQGELKRIGLRASVLRTLDGSEVILPNGQLISEEVTNWTFSDRQRRIEINVGVAYGTDPREVMRLLDGVSKANKDILEEPPSRSIFVGFGDSSLDFQMRAWTDRADQWVVVRSDLTVEIHDVLKEAGIEIPFPQRDLHLRGIDSDAIKSIKGINSSTSDHKKDTKKDE